MMACEPVSTNFLTHSPRPRLRFPHVPAQSQFGGEDVGERRRARSGSPCFAAVSRPDGLARSTSPTRLATVASKWQADALSPRTSSASLAHQPGYASLISVHTMVPASGQSVTVEHQPLVVASSVVAAANISPRSRERQVVHHLAPPYPVLLPRRNRMDPVFKSSRQEHPSPAVKGSQWRSTQTQQEPVSENIGIHDGPSLRRTRCTSPLAVSSSNTYGAHVCEPTATHQPIAWCTASARGKPQKNSSVVLEHSSHVMGMPDIRARASASLSNRAPAGTALTSMPAWHAAPPALPQEDVVSFDPVGSSVQRRPTAQHKLCEAEICAEPRIANRFANVTLTPWPARIEDSTVETDVPLPSFVKRSMFSETGLLTADSPRAEIRVTHPSSPEGVGETAKDPVDRIDDLQHLPSACMPDINPEVIELCEDTREQVNHLLRMVQDLGSEVGSLRRENQQLEDAIDFSREGPEHFVTSSTQSSMSPTSSQEIGSPRMISQLGNVASPEELGRRDSEIDETASVGLHPLSDTEHATTASRNSPFDWGASASSLPGIDLPALLQDLRAQPETKKREEARPSSKPTVKGWRKLRRDMKAASALESLLRAVRRGKVQSDAGNELDVGSLSERGHYWGVDLRPVKARRNRSKNATPKVALRRTPSQPAVMPWGGVGVGSFCLQPTEFESK